MNVAVVIASLGRPQVLGELLEDLTRQSWEPDRILLSLTSPDDAPANAAQYPNVEVIYGPKGLCAQRNAALEHVGSASDIVFFVDDDYVPSRFSVERAVQLMTEWPDLAGACGDLLADGINGPGVSLDEAHRLLAEYDRREAPPIVPSHDLGGLYGCNMIYRASAIRGLRFDERLALYGWQEDIDFAARAGKQGRIVKTFAFAGVHRGVKAARTSGVRVGYSQVVNPVYLVRKGTMQRAYARKIIWRNVAANHLRAIRPEPWVDRVGRLRGNWIGIFDLLLGRVQPERILQL